MLTYESRVTAYNEASELLKARPKMLPGWFVCKRKGGDFVLWPMVGMPPKTYRVVDEVFS